MKLLSTITALLLSFLAFSQDLIEYNYGTYSKNGEELSIEEVEQLTKELKFGWCAKYLCYIRSGNSQKLTIYIPIPSK